MPPDRLLTEFSATRERSVADCAPLALEDYTLQAAAFASPPKWHLAHTSWFFETFILKPLLPAYETAHPAFEVLFNSYYNGIGEQHPRDRRGLLSRPLLEEVMDYRRRIDTLMPELLVAAPPETADTVRERCILGIEHERQHQELFYTDIKYSLAANPTYPAFCSESSATGEEDRSDRASQRALAWDGFEGGIIEQGFAAGDFCFDNELPRHRVFIEPFELADRLVSNAEYQAFIDDGAYERPELWLADGWALLQSEGWKAPLHWVDRGGEALEYTLYGLRRREDAAPVCHVSGYEAEAYARWAGARLPTEAEWEHAATTLAPPSRGRDHGLGLHPQAATGADRQYFGACWQWTRSAYEPYPGYRPSPGAIGEYNGKFMSNQWVLRGGSCVTWSSQARPSYRNFFYPGDRWQFSGIRLAR
ncbi:MAG: ergothioneine biosynthesis protein EgtB [Halieaceae bacterium]|jgi:ergothioneine biosynthesis protein EgtB|nr:ergothioneine biosynthesis protein EgtB [Halieaceae bacterium]